VIVGEVAVLGVPDAMLGEKVTLRDADFRVPRS
jgi:hypothetical protein